MSERSLACRPPWGLGWFSSALLPWHPFWPLFLDECDCLLTHGVGRVAKSTAAIVQLACAHGHGHARGAVEANNRPARYPLNRFLDYNCRQPPAYPERRQHAGCGPWVKNEGPCGEWPL